MIIQIQPITPTVNFIDISVENYNLESGVDIIYTTTSDDNSLVSSGKLQLSKEEIQDWGSDNDYIVDIVLKKLGYNRK